MTWNVRRAAVTVFVLSVAPNAALLAQPVPVTAQIGPAPTQGGGGEIAAPVDDITDQQRQDIQALIDRHVVDLSRRGIIALPTVALVPFGWPLGPASVLADYGYHGMSAFVDHDPAFPGQLRDYQCGRRTYDTSSGVNHRGTDFFIWPFPWLKMDNSLVHIVAAAPGTIVGKLDGYSDRSCAMNSSSWNAVYVRHADGSVAWYGHMKTGSTTTKAVGASVLSGEYLGTVGSSGSSTGPHLHLELHDAAGALIDPYEGACNLLPSGSWWLAQPPYYDSAINTLTTGSAPPSFGTCPLQEVPNAQTTFAPGSRIYFATYYRDQMAGQSSTYTIRRPDGSVYASWTATSPATYSGSYWYWNYANVAPAGPFGPWRFEVVYQSRTYVRDFVISNSPQGCAYSLSAPSASVGAGAGAGNTVGVTTVAGCDWAAISNASWIAVTSGASGVGGGVVTYSAAANSGAARIGTLTIGGQTFTVNQAGVMATVDTDGDGLPDAWETQFGLNPNSAGGADGATGDPDGDGRTNLQEYQAGTHPRGYFTRYFAEGATSVFFDCAFALVNPNVTASSVLLRFLESDGTVASQWISVPANTRRSVGAKDVAGLATAEFSTVVESDVAIVADRTMTWDATGYGSHAETSVATPSTTWYLAEGATHSGFDLFYLMQNPNATAAAVTVTYLLPAPAAPVVRAYAVPANSRFNIWVNQEGAALASTDVSATVTSINGVPIIVERAMYLESGGLTFGAGHESAGVTAPATSWFLPEGATGPYFDLFILVANPGATEATIRATFLLPSGATVERDYAVPAMSRFNIWVDTADPQLANTAVSTTIASTNGVSIIAERAMWWPGTAATWQEAHNSPGSTVTGTKWALAEGEIGGARTTATYVLIANTSAFAGSASVTLLFEDGTSTAKTFPLNANSRLSVDVAAEFASAAGRTFGAVVQSLGATPAQIVVERAMYSNANGVTWAAGTNALATRLQ